MYRNASFKTYSGIERSNMVASFCRIAFLGEKRVKQDQSQCEDTLSENRQSKLEEEFSSFVDGTRMDACDRFREIYKPKDQFTDVHCQRLACLIFEVCSNSCLYIDLSNEKKKNYNVDSVTGTSIKYNWLHGIMTLRSCVGITETNTDPRLL